MKKNTTKLVYMSLLVSMALILSIFESMGYYLIDDVKPDIWGNSNVEWWYQQNIMILKKTNNKEKKKLFFAIHPELYKIKVEEIRKLDTNYQKVISGHISVWLAFKILIKALKNSIKKGN